MDTKRHSAHVCFYRPLIFTLVITACHPTTGSKEATPEEIATFFKESHKKVLTFVGYSGAEYEDKAAMLSQAKRVLAEFDPAKTIVNIGATLDGIGAVYEEAKRLGFVTTGTVSTQARESKAALSPYVDHVFYVKDATWGGLLESTGQLSPTSTAMVMSSDVIVGIGGGDVARDEMLAAKQLGKEVRFIPADMNHRIAIEKAEKKGQSSPTEFHGAAHAVFSATDNQTRNSTEETPHHDSQANGRGEVAQMQVAQAEGLLRSGRAFLFDTVRQVWNGLQAQAAPSLEQRALLRLTATQAAMHAAQVIDLMYHAAGTSSIWAHNPLQRHFRDVHVVTQHAILSTPIYEMTGRVFLGQPVETAVL